MTFFQLFAINNFQVIFTLQKHNDNPEKQIFMVLIKGMNKRCVLSGDCNHDNKTHIFSSICGHLKCVNHKYAN